jgi:hypothetical protein
MAWLIVWRPRNGMDVAQFKEGRIRSLYVFLNDQHH